VKERSSSVGTRCIASEVEGGEAHSHSVTGRLLVMVPGKRLHTCRGGSGEADGKGCLRRMEGFSGVNRTGATQASPPIDHATPAPTRRAGFSSGLTTYLSRDTSGPYALPYPLLLTLIGHI